MIPLDPAKLHAYFAALPGSDRIATSFALRGLVDWLERRQPERVCDIGVGIGTTTALIARWSAAAIVAVEDDPWCHAQAVLNLRHLRWIAHDIIWYDKIPHYMTFQFVVLDGHQVRLEDWACLESRAVVFVEGGRRGQRAALEAWLRAEHRPFCHAEWKPPRTRSKGYAVYVMTPTRWERLWFAGVRWREGWRDLRARLSGAVIGKNR